MNIPERRRVVITGIGMVTPLGLTKDETWANLLAGKNGVGPITIIDTTGYSVTIGAEVSSKYDPTEYMDKKDAKRYDRFVHFATGAAAMAISDSKINFEECDRERCGCIIGSGIGGMRSSEELMRNFLEKGPKRVSPLTVPKIMVNCACGIVAIDHGLKGVNYAPVTACASGSHSIGLGMRHIQWGEADVIVAGGSEAGISYLGLGGFQNMTALSNRIDDPEHASRPFDKDRDGFVLGEGGGMVVLEELEHAKKRNATIYAEVCGYGFTDDAHHITAPDETGDGPARCIALALKDSGFKPEDVDYVNPHGTSTPYNDKTESKAIKRALGDHAYKIKVTSTKSMVGHMLGAAGGVEAGVLALSLMEQRIHGTRNYTTPDPECDLDYQPNEACDMKLRVGLSNSLGFGGHNCTLCLSRFDD